MNLFDATEDRWIFCVLFFNTVCTVAKTGRINSKLSRMFLMMVRTRKGTRVPRLPKREEKKSQVLLTSLHLSAMLVLYETAMGYCLFKMSDAAKLDSADLWKEFESPEKANKLYGANSHIYVVFQHLMCNRLKLKALHRFTSTATAVEDITALQDGKIGKGLKKFLTDEVLGKGKGKDSLLVIDPHLCSSHKTSSYNGEGI